MRSEWLEIPRSAVAGRPANQAVGPHDDRRTAGVRFVVAIGAELSQGVEQVGNRARARVGAVPSSRKTPWPSVAKAVRNRMVPPLLPAAISVP